MDIEPSIKQLADDNMRERTREVNKPEGVCIDELPSSSPTSTVKDWMKCVRGPARSQQNLPHTPHSAPCTPDSRRAEFHFENAIRCRVVLIHSRRGTATRWKWLNGSYVEPASADHFCTRAKFWISLQALGSQSAGSVSSEAREILHCPLRCTDTDAKKQHSLAHCKSQRLAPQPRALLTTRFQKHVRPRRPLGYVFPCGSAMQLPRDPAAQ